MRQYTGRRLTVSRNNFPLTSSQLYDGCPTLGHTARLSCEYAPRQFVMKPLLDILYGPPHTSFIGGKMWASPTERPLALPPAKDERPMRELPHVKVFPTDLIGDMHTAFEAVCAKLGSAAVR
jgi:hypothetical protein